MKLSPLTLLGLGTVVGIALWSSFNLITGVGEPWDHQQFGGVYALSLVLAAAVGSFASSRAWIGGVAITFAMLPVMIVFAGTGPLIAVGILFLIGLSIPAALAASVGSFLSGRIIR